MWIFCRLFYVLDSVERQTKMITHQLQIIRANCVSVVSMVPGTEKGDFFFLTLDFCCVLDIRQMGTFASTSAKRD